MAVKCHKMMKEKMDLHLEFLKQTSSQYHNDPSDDNFSVLEDGAEPQLLNKELGFLFTAPRTRSGRMVGTSNKAVLWL